MPWKDPDLLGRYGMAAAGAGLYGLYLFAIKLRSGGQLTRKDLNWLALNVGCAVAASRTFPPNRHHQTKGGGRWPTTPGTRTCSRS